MDKRPVPPFHLAIPVDDLTAARTFYGGLLACPEGRSSDRWVDFNLYGHQLVCHLVHGNPVRPAAVPETNPVDGYPVPVPHFGVVLEMEDWQTLCARLCESAIQFTLEPHLRFRGLAGEQATVFFLDPSGNALEFKAFHDVQAQLFER